MTDVAVRLGEQFSSLLDFLLHNPLTVFNTLLLILTAYLGYTSFKFQTRTSIRESLEQLDDADVGGRGKLRPILHSFKFRVFGKSEATVQLRHYIYTENPAASSRTYRPLFHIMINRVTSDEEGLTREVIEEALLRKVCELEEVDDAWIGEKGVFLVFYSRNAVEIRTRTETVVDVIEELHTTNAERLVERLEIETGA